MARPEKQWLDYFSFDVFIDSDDKIQLLEIDTGIEWFWIFIKILCYIYSNWYYCERNEKKQKLFARSKWINLDKLNKVIEICLREWLFDQKMYKKYKILTSKWIQKRLVAWITRRKSYTFIEQYLLITEKYINENVWKVNVNINSINVNINSINDDINTQSKVKERKEKENIFEIFWKTYPHSRKWKKKDSLNYFIKLDIDEVMSEVKLLNWETNLWIQNTQYIPACERWIRDFTTTSDVVKDNKIKAIINKLMTMEVWDKRKEYYKWLCEDFGKDKIDLLAKEWNKLKNSITLNLK